MILNHDTPFIGRQALLAQVQQALNTPRGDTLCFIGQKGIGKTALLRHLPTLDGDSIGVYLGLAHLPTGDASAFWVQYVTELTTVLQEAQFNVLRLPVPDEPIHLAWVQETWMPEVIKLIRAHRRILLLLDDAEAWELTDFASLLAQLAQFMTTFEALRVIFSADLALESTLLTLPTIRPERVIRLHRFSVDDHHALIAHYHPNASDALLRDCYEWTGGFPLLAQQLAQELQQSSPTQLSVATDNTYRTLKTWFREHWRALGRNERIILTAYSNMAYDDPLRAITPMDLEAWLAQTDDPLDLTTIHATLRSLEYQEWVTLTPQTTTVTAKLLARWLHENARADAVGTQTVTTWRLTLVALFVGIILLGVAIALVLLQTNAPTDTLIPTVTFPR